MTRHSADVIVPIFDVEHIAATTFDYRPGVQTDGRAPWFNSTLTIKSIELFRADRGKRGRQVHAPAWLVEIASRWIADTQEIPLSLKAWQDIEASRSDVVFIKKATALRVVPS